VAFRSREGGSEEFVGVFGWLAGLELQLGNAREEQLVLLDQLRHQRPQAIGFEQIKRLGRHPELESTPMRYAWVKPPQTDE
jgi:hypothetical protein